MGLGLVVGCALLAPAGVAFGQGSSFAAAEPQGPEVEESATVRNLLRTAEDAISREDWKLAIDSLRRIVDEPQGLLARSSAVYESPRRYANRMLATLPEGGRAAFRLLYDGAGRALLDKARRDHDIGALQDLCDHFLPSRYGIEATGLLASWLIDLGREAEALVLLDDLLATVPREAAVPVTIQYKRAVALALLGDRDGARSILSEVRGSAGNGADQTPAGAHDRSGSAADEVPNAAGPGRGASRNLAAAVEAFIERVDTFAPARGDANMDWTGPGGGGPCHGLMTHVVPSFAEDLPWRRKIPGMYADLWPLEGDFLEANTPPVSQGVAVDGRLFVLTAVGCMAIDLKSFAVMWTSPNVAEGIAERSDARRSPNPTHEDSVTTDYVTGSLTAGHGLVFTIERGEAGAAFDQEGVAVVITPRRSDRNKPETKNRLVAYDASTGAIRWQRGQRADPDPRLAMVQFLAPPVSDGVHLWVPFERSGDLYVGVLDPSHGQWLREILLCAMGGRPVSSTNALLPAVADGFIYIPSHHGLLFAVDAREQAVRWATRYREDPAPRRVRRRRPAEPLVPQGWLPGPPVVTGRLVVLAPVDDDRLLVFNRFTGELLWELPRQGHRYIIATDGQDMWLGGPEISAISLSERAYVWTVPAPAATGRAVLSGHTIYVPARSSLTAIDDLSGETRRVYDLPADQTPLGNLLCIGDSMVSIDPTEVRAFPDRNSYAATLAAHAADPTEVRNAIRLAFMELLNHKPEAALAALRDVRIPESADADSHRAHVAHLRVTALLRMGQRPGTGVDTAVDCLRRAVGYARDRRDQVAARLALGDTLRRIGRYKEAYKTLWELGRGPLGDDPVRLGSVTRVVRLVVADALRRISPELSPTEVRELSSEAAGIFESAVDQLATPTTRGEGLRSLRGLADVVSLDGWDQTALDALGRFELQRKRYERAEQYLTESIRRGEARAKTGGTESAQPGYRASRTPAEQTAEALLGLLDLYTEPAQSLAGSAATVARRLTDEFGGVVVDGMSVAEQVKQRQSRIDAARATEHAAATDVRRFEFTGRRPYAPLVEGKPMMITFRSQRPESLAGRHLLLADARTLRAYTVADGSLEWESDLLLLNDFAYQTEQAPTVSRRLREDLPLAVIDGQTAILNGPKGLHAVGVISGNRLWAREATGAALRGDPTLREQTTGAGSGRVACMLSSGVLSVRRILDGGLIWERDVRNGAPGAGAVGVVVIRDDLVLTADSRLEHVHVYRLDDGVALCDLTFDQGDGESYESSSADLAGRIPIAYSHGVLCGPDGAGVTAYDARSGEKRWSLALPSRLTSVFAPAPGRLVISTVAAEHRLVDSSTGEVLLASRFEDLHSGATDGVLESGMLVLAGAQVIEDGVRWELVGVDVATGRERWSRDLVGTADGPGPRLRAARGVIPVVEMLAESSSRVSPQRRNDVGSGRMQLQRVVLIDKRTGLDIGDPVYWDPGPGEQLTGYLDVWPGRVILQMTGGVAALETVPVEGQTSGADGVN